MLKVICFLISSYCFALNKIVNFSFLWGIRKRKRKSLFFVVSQNTRQFFMKITRRSGAFLKCFAAVKFDWDCFLGLKLLWRWIGFLWVKWKAIYWKRCWLTELFSIVLEAMSLWDKNQSEVSQTSSQSIPFKNFFFFHIFHMPLWKVKSIPKWITFSIPSTLHYLYAAKA